MDTGDLEAGGKALQAARDRLGDALARLEARVAPVAARLEDMGRKLGEAGTLQADRTALAERLDAATAQTLAREAELADLRATVAAREAEFEALSRESGARIEAVIAQVQTALGQAPGTGAA